MDRLSALAIVLDENLTTARIIQYDFGLKHFESLLAPYIKSFAKFRDALQKANEKIDINRLDMKLDKDFLLTEDLRAYVNSLQEKLDLLVVIMYDNNLLPDAIMDDDSMTEETDFYDGNPKIN